MRRAELFNLRRGCYVKYDSQKGYSETPQRGQYSEGNVIPHVSCRRDGRSMYPSQVKPEKKSYRLWKCPRCGGGYEHWELSAAQVGF